VNNPETDAEFDPFANESAKKKSNGGPPVSAGAGIAWLAMILAMLTIAYNAYQWWQDQSANPEDRSRQLEVDELRQTQAGLQQALETVQRRIGTQEQKDDSTSIAAIQSDIGAMQARLSETGLNASGDHALIEAMQLTLQDMAQRIGEIETTVAALAVRGDSPEKSMDVAEVDYLLRLAGERLAIFGDIASAEIALGLADTQLQALNDPLYLAVRRKIDESRTALAQVPALDTVLISGKIADLQSSVPKLAFPGETPVEVLVQDQPDAGLWQKIKNAIKPLVTVRRRVDESLELSLEDKDFLRQGLWLQLESARLALMRRDALAWDLSLSRAKDSVASRFDPQSKSVKDALTGLDELAAVEMAQELPDVSAPWRQLRLLREGSVKAQSGAGADDGANSDPADEAETDVGDPQG
jgi:uroporphyrin-3 C-methyltransferase